MSLLVLGSIALDTIQTPSGGAKEIPGGSGIYASVSASFFTPVTLIGIAGHDFPQRYVKFLERRKIDLTGVQVTTGETFRWHGAYEHDFNVATTLATHLNVLKDFYPVVPTQHQKSRWVLLANIDPLIQQAVLQQLRRRCIVACDSMNFWIEHSPNELRNVLRQSDIIVLNDAEAMALTGEAKLAKAAKILSAWGAQGVVIKKGEHGVIGCLRGHLVLAPAYVLEEVCDPTGAGDSFAGGLMGFIASQGRLTLQTFREAIVYGSVLASFTVEQFGTRRLERLTSHEVKDRVRQFRLATQF